MSAAGFLIFLGAIGTGLALLVASPSSELPQAERPASPDPREATRREMLQLKGTWSTMTTVESTINGVPQKPKQVKMIWSIDRDLIKDTDEDGFAGKSYRFTLDPQKVPKHIDLTVLNSGLKLYGIYKLEGNALTVSLGGIRPRRFRGRSASIPAPLSLPAREPDPGSTGPGVSERPGLLLGHRA